MRKFLKTLSFVMSAAVSLAAVPMISADNTDVSAEFDADYCMNPCNYAWVKKQNTANLQRSRTVLFWISATSSINSVLKQPMVLSRPLKA